MMRTEFTWGGRRVNSYWLCLALFFVFSGSVLAQPPGRRRPNRRGGVGVPGGSAEKKEEKKESPPPLPSDKRLLALHRQFVADAEKLALEYEQGEEWDRAKSVYQEIVKLVPQHVAAQTRLKMLRAREANAVVKQFKVRADKDWQDTYIDVVRGKPVQIRAIGSWTFNLSIRVSPDGIKIPDELKDYNLGCLIGVIRAPGDKEFNPFVIGRGTKFVADKDGRLYLRMYDVSPQDNEGELDVEVRGSYRSGRRDE